MPFIEFSAKAEIERQCATDPEFKRLWEERQKEENQFFTDTVKGLCEAVEIEKGNIPLVERKDMPAKTYYVSTKN